MPSKPTASDDRTGQTLRTDRLSLDVPEPSDAAAVLAIAGDPRTVEHNPADLLGDLHDAEALVGRWVGHWQERGFGYWCVREIGESRVVGYCGVKHTVVQGRPALNLIYRFLPEVWGRGYATEAAQAAVTWAASHCGGATIVARVRPDNVASRNVASKAGLRRDPSLDEYGQDGLDLVFSNRVATP